MTSIRLSLAAALAASAVSTVAAEHFVWFGTSTGGAGKSRGIFVARFDPETGALGAAGPAAETPNPSFLAVHPRLPMLYAVAEVGDPDGSVAAFRIDPASGGLAAVNRRSSGGPGPCHVSVDPAGRVVLAANYSGGSVVCFGIAADGSLAPQADAGFLRHAAAEQPAAKPLAHSIDAVFGGRFAISCDKGLDRVFVHALDVERATLAAHGAVPLEAGSGPRHFAAHPGGRFGYVVNERGLTVTALACDAGSGALAPFQTISTLPADVEHRKGLSTAEIAVHPGGRTLYASKRGHDSIAVFGIDEATGRLAFRGTEPARGKTPRHFAIAPGGRYLLAAGQNSGTVAVFAIDAATGDLEFTGRTIEVPAPMCIVFSREPLPVAAVP